MSPEVGQWEDESAKIFDYKQCLNAKYGQETRKEFESYLSSHGGLYKPEFGYDHLFDNQGQKKGWSKFLDVIKDAPNDSNVTTTIKKMKGQK